MSTLRAAVVGVGHLGKNHARIYTEIEGVELAGVVDCHPGRAEKVARKCRTRAFSSVKEIPGRLDAVSVVVPTDRHYDVAGEVLALGANVLIEKPITETVKQAEALLRVAEEKGLTIQVGHVERFNPALLALEKIIRAPRFIEIHRLAPYQPRGTEVGVVLDLMIHDLDILLHLVRSPVKEVSAVGVPILSRGEDIANARITFENGCIANVTASRITPEKRMRKIRLFQPDAYISLDYQKQEGLIYRRLGSRIISEIIPTKKDEPLKLEILSFLDSVRARTRPRVPGEHGLHALRIALEITRMVTPSRSSQEG